MRITVLVENTTKEEKLGAEHGLSLYIETAGKRILFDMGQSTLFEKNAKVLGIDLSQVDFAVLSHGHYDHGGGLGRFLELNGRAPVYLSEYGFGDHYHGKIKYIGLDQKLRKEKQIHLIGDKIEITDGIWLYPALNDLQIPISSGGLMRKNQDLFLDEDFRHEQYLLIEEKGKKILFSGCSHRGILNIVSQFQPKILIGGFHFSKWEPDQGLEEIAGQLAEYATRYYTCHCTGITQYQFMKKRMKNLSYLSVGDSLEI